jgi:alanine racemase
MHQDSELLSTHYGLGMLSDIGNIDASRIHRGVERLHSLHGASPVQVIFYQDEASPLDIENNTQELTKALQGCEALCLGTGLTRLSDAIEGAVALTSLADFMQRPADFLNPKASYLLQGAWSPNLLALRTSLSAQSHQTHVQINLEALVQNLNKYRSQLPSDTQIMVMVKAFAYGNGGAEIAHLLAYHNVDYLAVAYVDEGVLLRNEGVLVPIMVLNSAKSELALMITHCLEPVIYSLEHLEHFTALCESGQMKDYPVHLEFDTGMHRLGFEPGQRSAVIECTSNTTALRVGTVFTHLYASDGTDLSLAQAQLDLFEIIRADFRALDSSIGYHALNSAGITRFPKATLDMVRLGIGLYGFSGDEAFNESLTPILTWTTSISQVRDVAAGDTVGYGGILRLERPYRIAVIPVGYADGIDRSLGNGVGGVYIGPQFCPFVGNICMDMSMIDLGDLHVNNGDSAEIIGPNQSIEDLAKAANTIPYEILTGIPPRVKRSYVWLG